MKHFQADTPVVSFVVLTVTLLLLVQAAPWGIYAPASVSTPVTSATTTHDTAAVVDVLPLSVSPFQRLSAIVFVQGDSYVQEYSPISIIAASEQVPAGSASVSPDDEGGKVRRNVATPQCGLCYCFVRFDCIRYGHICSAF